MDKIKNFQDYFLNRARLEKMSLTMFLMNGFQLRGTVKYFDNYVVIIDSDNKEQMVYKHAISTIVPFRNLDIDYREVMKQ